ncbi:SDR family NAD(P)-dependent oxidoreductase [Brevibacillus dissolubilis]|uniref:SDR family NAD(P)-dependent oxidoreductase n=1 Tax=Brevibacillus dissolubilis TaxID=1844116 RepID=UPI001115F7C5|nr:SDR family oxidoreductase [Brevibacillus dissolubilis]
MSSSKQTALITGASGGIGLDLAREFAKDGHNLVLVARSQQKLEQFANELRQQYHIDVTIIAKDLSKLGAPEEIYQEVTSQAIQIDVLVNNAGVGLFGEFADSELQSVLDMMQLNMVSLTHMTKLFLQPMVKRDNGKILNVASTGGFQPGPLMAVYYATKAYVLSFTEAIASELRGTGVSVSVFCPGPTKTGFDQAASAQQSKLFTGMMVMECGEVCRLGYREFKKGKTLIIPGFINKVLTKVHRIVPRKVMPEVVRYFSDRTNS